MDGYANSNRGGGIGRIDGPKMDRPPENRDLPEMGVVLMEYDRNLDELEKNIITLIDRLSAVLGRASDEKEKCLAQVGLESSLAQALQQKNSRLYVLSMLVEVTTQRLRI